jgi:hypothetical protein
LFSTKQNFFSPETVMDMLFVVHNTILSLFSKPSLLDKSLVRNKYDANEVLSYRQQSSSEA